MSRNRATTSFLARVGLLLLALLPALILAPCPAALAAGARPWFLPGQQENATANATDDASATDSATGRPDTAAPGAQPSAATPQAPARDEAARQAQDDVLRRFFRGQVTLDDDFPEVFSRRVKDGEAMAFLTMREMQRRRGLLERFRSAEVDLGGLMFERVTDDPDLARIRVTGRYSFSVPPVERTVEEDALFVLLPEMGQWKIFERREGWRP